MGGGAEPQLPKAGVWGRRPSSPKAEVWGANPPAAGGKRVLEGRSPQCWAILQ